MATSRPVLTGSCQCGCITYSSSTLPSALCNCYCTICRRLSGAPFITFGSFPTSSLTWTSGLDSLKKTTYSDIAERSHCAECGSPISMSYKCESEKIYIAAGTINEESVKGGMPKITQHIFVKEKAAWYDLPIDQGSKNAKFSIGYQKKIDAWREAMRPGLG